MQSRALDRRPFRARFSSHGDFGDAHASDRHKIVVDNSHFVTMHDCFRCRPPFVVGGRGGVSDDFSPRLT